jgi:hypothetical protein
MRNKVPLLQSRLSHALFFYVTRLLIMQRIIEDFKKAYWEACVVFANAPRFTLPPFGAGSSE